LLQMHNWAYLVWYSSVSQAVVLSMAAKKSWQENRPVRITEIG
jgi:hypothetical protein